MAIFDHDYVEKIPVDPENSVVDIVNRAFSLLHKGTQEWQPDEYPILLEAFALVSSIEDSGLLSFGVGRPLLPTGKWEEDCRQMNAYLQAVREAMTHLAQQNMLANMKSGFSTLLTNRFHYKFSPADIDRMQTLINELRQQITESTLYSDEHRARLLKRLEGLQSEVHKKMSDLDKFWGLIGDAGVAIGKFGNDAKPLVDRIVELTQIVWNSQKDAEQLPSNVEFPLLPSINLPHGPDDNSDALT